jgi:hypothetical protein
MAQGDNTTGQKGADAMFVMNHNDIKKALKASKKITYANPVVDHQPQKADPNQICITARGNLIQYDSGLLVPMADIDMAKLHWNSVICMVLAKNMCIDIKIITF